MIQPKRRDHLPPHHLGKAPFIGREQGFALVEVIVAIAIMALVGLMAWRGMDAMIRGRETIERRSNQDAEYSQLVRQFEKDCQEILRHDELAALSAQGANSVAAGAKNIWWVRRYRADNQDSWMIVGYGMSAAGLQRWTSSPLLRRTDVGALWAGISRDPDLNSSDLLVSLEVPTIVRQGFQVQTSIVSGAGSSGISASGTGKPVSSAVTSPVASASSSDPTAVSNIYPDPQGLVMQWWMKDMPLPITRSCLMGGAL